MKTKKATFIILYHLGLLVFSLIIAMLVKYRQTGKAFVPETWLVFCTIYALALAIGYIVNFMIKKAGRLSHERLNRLILPAFVLFSLTTLLLSNVIVILGVFIWYFLKGNSFNNFVPQLLEYELPYANRNMIIWLIVFAVIFFYILWKKSVKKEQQLREEKLKFQYQTLKSQMNPHFLFNSFNTLSELIYEDPVQADHYIQELSGIYRYILEKDDTKTVPLREELDLVKRYYNLQKVRNEGKILLNLEVSDSDNYEVIPTSVQMLVENAIKHNASSVSLPLFISIYLENKHIVIKNNLQKKNVMETTTRRGLKILEEQVRLVHGKGIIINEGDHEYIVKLPLILRK